MFLFCDYSDDGHTFLFRPRLHTSIVMTHCATHVSRFDPVQEESAEMLKILCSPQELGLISSCLVFQQCLTFSLFLY